MSSDTGIKEQFDTATLYGDPQRSLSTRELFEVFQPVFDRVADGAVEREQQRILPFEQFAWLNEHRFGALTVPRSRGGYGASLEQVAELLIVLAAIVLLVMIISSGSRQKRELSRAADKTCGACGSGHPPFAVFCRKCGKKL